MPHPLIPLIKNKSMFISLAEEFDTPLYFYDENEIRKSIIYTFHLARKAQAAKKINDGKKK